MKIIVTGSLGFIGSKSAKKFLEKDVEVLGIDSLNPTLYPNSFKEKRLEDLQTHPNYTHSFHDLRENLDESFFEGVEQVVHFAALAGLNKSWENFKSYQDCNVLGTFHLLEGIRKFSPNAHLIHISTSSVYGANALGDENSEINPISPYGITKLASENIVKMHQDIYKVEATILRLFSVYGPDQRPDMGFSNIINQIRENRIIKVFGDGGQSRSNTYIDDVVNAVHNCSMEKPSGIFNVCGTEEKTILEFIYLVGDLLGKKPQIQFEAERVGDQSRTRGDSQKIRNATGWEPKIKFAEGVASQVLFQVNNR
jgi:nucleoside-diphosphate-sugar epimerase